jgi:hypothetical protein
MSIKKTLIALLSLSFFSISGCNNAQHTSHKIQVKPSCPQQDYDLGAKFIKNTGIAENVILGMVLNITNKPLNSTPKIRECIASDTYKRLNREKPLITKAVENIDACSQLKLYSRKYMQTYNDFFQKNSWLETKISAAYAKGLINYIKNPHDARLMNPLPDAIKQSTNFLMIGANPGKLIKIDFYHSLTQEQKTQLKSLGDKLTRITDEDIKNHPIKNQKDLEEFKKSEDKRSHQLIETLTATITHDLTKIILKEEIKCRLS